MDFLLKCNSLIEKISKHVLMTFALNNDQWHVKRKKAKDNDIFQLSVEKREYLYTVGDTCTFRILYALKVFDLKKKTFKKFFFKYLRFGSTR